MDVRQLPNNFLGKDFSHHQILRFIVTNTFPAFVNTIRRIILTYVPTIAIEDVIFVENTTALFDEYIAHRLGLIPLNSDVDYLNVQEDCDVCEGAGCNSCTVTLTLTQETDLQTTMTIYSRDLIPSDPNVYPVVDEIPIMKMGPDQRLILEAVARLGTGREHAKWQSVGSVGYQYMPIIEIRPGHKFTREVADACPRRVLEFDEKNQTVNIKDLLSCNLCMECVDTAKDDSILVKGDPSQIIFLVESNGSLPVENIVTKAADILEDMANTFIESFQVALENAENDPSAMKKVSTFERISINRD